MAAHHHRRRRCRSAPRRRLAGSRRTVRDALTNISRCCDTFGPARNRSITKAPTIASNAHSPRCGVRSTPHVPIWFGGVSDAAIEVGAKHCDVYALFGEPRAAIAESIARVRAIAARSTAAHPRFNVSFRPIIAATESAAWAKAESKFSPA